MRKFPLQGGKSSNNLHKKIIYITKKINFQNTAAGP